jgi:hypothetical protein
VKMTEKCTTRYLRSKLAWALTTAPYVAALVSPTTVVHRHPRPHWSSIKRLAVQNAVISMNAPSEESGKTDTGVYGSGFVGT